MKRYCLEQVLPAMGTRDPGFRLAPTLGKGGRG
jgi:hypothetical protein